MTGWYVPECVAWLTSEAIGDPPGTVYAVQLPDGPPLVLSDTAAVIWLLLADIPDAVAKAHRVAKLNGLALGDLGEETIDRFARELAAVGLLIAREGR